MSLSTCIHCRRVFNPEYQTDCPKGGSCEEGPKKETKRVKSKEVKMMLAVAEFAYRDGGWISTQEGDVIGMIGETMRKFDLDNPKHRNTLFSKLRLPEYGAWTIQEMKGYWRALNVTIDEEKRTQMQGKSESPTLLGLVWGLLPEGDRE